MGKRIRQVTVQEKVIAIDRVHNGESKASVARDIQVPESTLRGWCKSEDKLRTLAQTSPKDSPNSTTSTYSSEEFSLDLSLKRPDHDFNGPTQKRQRTSPLLTATPSILTASNITMTPQSFTSPLVSAITSSPIASSSSPPSIFSQTPFLPPASMPSRVSLPAQFPITSPVAIPGSAISQATLGLSVATPAQGQASLPEHGMYYNIIRDFQLRQIIEHAKINLANRYSNVDPSSVQQPGAFLNWFRSSTSGQKTPPMINNNKHVNNTCTQQKENSAPTVSPNLEADGRRLVLDTLYSGADRDEAVKKYLCRSPSTSSDTEEDDPPSFSEALIHAQKFLRYLDCCSHPELSETLIHQYRYLVFKLNKIGKLRRAAKSEKKGKQPDRKSRRK